MVRKWETGRGCGMILMLGQRRSTWARFWLLTILPATRFDWLLYGLFGYPCVACRYPLMFNLLNLEMEFVCRNEYAVSRIRDRGIIEYIPRHLLEGNSLNDLTTQFDLHE